MNEVPPRTALAPELAGLGTARSLRTFARPGVAWVVLALCLLVTAIAWQVSLHQLNRRDYERFTLHMDQVVRAIQNRMQGYEQVLKGAEGLFTVSRSVERTEFHDYVAGLDINQRYPGIHALGFIAVVASNRVGGSVHCRQPPGRSAGLQHCFQAGRPNPGAQLHHRIRRADARQLDLAGIQHRVRPPSA